MMPLCIFILTRCVIMTQEKKQKKPVVSKCRVSCCLSSNPPLQKKKRLPNANDDKRGKDGG